MQPQPQPSRRPESPEGPIRLAVPEADSARHLHGAAPPVAPLLLTPPEAAKALRIGRRKLWELTKDGEIRAVRLGRSVRYDPRELQSWVDKISGRGENAAPGMEAGK